MLNKIVKEIEENYERYEVLNNGYAMQSVNKDCKAGCLYYDNDTKDFIEVGFDDKDNAIVINIKKEL